MTPTLEQPDVTRLNVQRPRPHPGDLANDAVHRFVHRAIRLCRPDRIYWCNGSAYERTKLSEQAIRESTLEPWTPDRLTVKPAADAPRAQGETEFQDCMAGRTMYVVPFMTNPIGTSPGNVGIQITDSLSVVLTMAKETRIGNVALRALGSNDTFSRGLHSARNGNLQYACACKCVIENPASRG